MAIAPTDCSVFVQVWVDVHAVQEGETTGCYALCNLSSYSTGEGTANLNAIVPTGSKICWTVLSIDPRYKDKFTISTVGSKAGWKHPPASVPDTPNVFTGQLSASNREGTVNSNIEFTYRCEGQSITVNFPINVTPVASCFFDDTDISGALPNGTIEKMKTISTGGTPPKNRKKAFFSEFYLSSFLEN